MGARPKSTNPILLTQREDAATEVVVDGDAEVAAVEVEKSKSRRKRVKLTQMDGMNDSSDSDVDDLV